jgi:hypothetical protein
MVSEVVGDPLSAEEGTDTERGREPEEKEPADALPLAAAAWEVVEINGHRGTRDGSRGSEAKPSPQR